MKDYISREEAKKAFAKVFDSGYVLQNSAQSDNILNNIPAEHVRPIEYGAWIRTKSPFGGDWYKCSKCGNEVKGNWNKCGKKICSYCGANMREGS